MSAGKIIGYIIAAILILFGVLFIWAAFSPEGETGWIFIGVITVAIGLGIIALIKLREPKPAQPPQEIIQKIDLSGEVELEKLKCQNCGAELDKDSITVKEGAIFVSCPYCGTAYQMVEEPKW
jgi:Zn finger protein HypA/HybF involved in hydrogenase expression